MATYDTMHSCYCWACHFTICLHLLWLWKQLRRVLIMLRGGLHVCGPKCPLQSAVSVWYITMWLCTAKQQWNTVGNFPNLEVQILWGGQKIWKNPKFFFNYLVTSKYEILSYFCGIWPCKIWKFKVKHIWLCIRIRIIFFYCYDFFPLCSKVTKKYEIVKRW